MGRWWCRWRSPGPRTRRWGSSPGRGDHRSRGTGGSGGRWCSCNVGWVVVMMGCHKQTLADGLHQWAIYNCPPGILNMGCLSDWLRAKQTKQKQTSVNILKSMSEPCHISLGNGGSISGAAAAGAAIELSTDLRRSFTIMDDWGGPYWCLLLGESAF